jgi:hypothetical protein
MATFSTACDVPARLAEAEKAAHPDPSDSGLDQADPNRPAFLLHVMLISSFKGPDTFSTFQRQNRFL